MTALQPASTNFTQHVSVKDVQKGKGWDKFFGDRGTTHQLDGYRRQSTAAFHLPEAYKGSNEFLGENIVLQVMTGDSWYTRVALPIRKINKLVVAWNSWFFDQNLTDEVPEEGISRILSVERETRTAGTVRRGLGFKLEHGFMTTASGVMNYVMYLRQIASAIMETSNMDVILAYLRSFIYENEWVKAYGQISSRDVVRVMNEERRMFAFVQKEKFSLYKLEAAAEEQTRKWQGRANMWIFPQKLSAFLTFAKSENSDYYLAGAQGPKRVRNYDGAKPYSIQGDMSIYLSRTYHLRGKEEIELMQRERQIGEYMLMIDRYANLNVKEHLTIDQEVAIYDEDTDQFEHITMVQALNECRLFDEGTGKIIEPKLRVPVRGFIDDIKSDPFVVQRKVQGQGDNVYEPIQYFGHMTLKHLSTQSVLNVARSINKQGGADLHLPADGRAIQDGINTLANIGRRPITAQWLDAVFKNHATRVRIPTAHYISSTIEEPVAEWNGGEALTLPDARNIPESAQLVGFTNWVGIEAMSQEYQSSNQNSITSNKGYNMNTLRDMHNLYQAVCQLASNAGRLLSDSTLLDPRYTAVQFASISRESVLFDNLFNQAQEALWRRKISSSPVQQYATDVANIKAASGVDIGSTIQSLQWQTAQGTQQFQDWAVKTAQKLKIFDDKDRSDAKTRVTKFQTALTQNPSPDGLAAHITAHWGDFQFKNKTHAEAFAADFKASLNAAMMDSSIAGGISEDITYYRSPLTLSASQIAALAMDVEQAKALGVTVSRANSFNLQPASATDLRHLGTLIKSTNDKSLTQQQQQAQFYGTSVDVQNAPVQYLYTREMHMQNVETPIAQIASQSSNIIRSSPNKRGMDFDSTGDQQKRMRYDEDAYLSMDIDSPYGDLTTVNIGAAGSFIKYTGPELKLGSDNLKAQLDAVEASSAEGEVKATAKLFLRTVITKQVLLNFAQNNIIIPMSFLILRPHMRYNMMFGIRTLAGSETGNTFVGHYDFQLGDDIKSKVHFGNFTYYSKAIVTNWRNVYIAYDIFANGRLGGGGSKFINPDRYSPNQGQFGGGDIIIVPLAYEERRLPNPIDASGRFSYFYHPGLSDRENMTELHYSTAARANSFWGFRPENEMGMYALNRFYHPLMNFDDTGEMLNTVCFRGAQRWYDRQTQTMNHLIENTGHWGTFCHTGCRDARDGNISDWRSPTATLIAT